MNIPLVHERDDGIRPAGPLDECFYCQQKVGQPHKIECVILNKKVKVRYVFDIEIEVPFSWDKGNIEFHRNESSWCASNALGDLIEFSRRDEPELPEGEHGCLCQEFHCEYLGEEPQEPQRKIIDAEHFAKYRTPCHNTNT